MENYDNLPSRITVYNVDIDPSDKQTVVEIAKCYPHYYPTYVGEGEMRLSRIDLEDTTDLN